MPKFLIWSLAFGKRGKRLARPWVHAVREIGGWKHDVVLLGDSHLAGTECQGARCIDIKADVSSRYQLRA